MSKKLAREDVTGYPLAELQATVKELATKIDKAARAKKSKQKELNALNKSIDSFFNKGIAKIYNGLDTGKLRLTGMRKKIFFELKKVFINLGVAIANGTIQSYDRIRQLFDKAYLGCCKIIMLLKGYSIKSNTTAKLANLEKTGLASDYNKNHIIAVNNLESCDNVVKYRQQELKYAENWGTKEQVATAKGNLATATGNRQKAGHVVDQFKRDEEKLPDHGYSLDSEKSLDGKPLTINPSDVGASLPEVNAVELAVLAGEGLGEEANKRHGMGWV